jgi:hypothetical protein
MPAPDYTDEYAAARARVRSLLADSGDDAGTVVPSCPDWTALAHMPLPESDIGE